MHKSMPKINGNLPEIQPDIFTDYVFLGLQQCAVLILKQHIVVGLTFN